MKSRFPRVLAGMLALGSVSSGIFSQPTMAATSKELFTPLPPVFEYAGPPASLVPLLQEAAQQHVDADLAWKMRFFEAILVGDKYAFHACLNEGMDPNAIVPFPPAPDFVKKVTTEPLRYYVASDPGVTAMFMAVALNRPDFVRSLLMAGASATKATQRHKTFPLWLAGKTQNVEIMRLLMKITPNDDAYKMRIDVNLLAQKATFWKGEVKLLETSISSGRESHPTPTGRYVITDKYKDWHSTIYPAKMPFFMRLSCGDFGFHVGRLPGYPASHGCIRLREEAAKKLFATAPIGTLVEIR